MKTLSVSVSKLNSIAQFETYYPKSFTELTGISSRHNWSPIVWQNGKRSKSNFISANLIALDFDEGFSLDEATGYLNATKYRAFIALSKSHGLEKIQKSGKILKACDRFRMVISTSATCINLSQYEENLKHWQTILPADSSCHDGGRFFYPSPRIWHVQDGIDFDWLDFTEKIETNKILAEKRKEKNKQHYAQVGTIPPKLKKIIVEGSEVGSRHKTCYWLGATFAEMGLEEGQTVNMIMSGPLGDIGFDEVVEAVKYGRKKVLGDPHE